jgi:hypothetical protein
MRAPNRPPHTRVRARAAASFLAAGALSCLSARAAAADGHDPRFELTPYLGYRIGGEFEQQNGSAKYELDESNSAGLIFNIAARDVNTPWQVLYGQQRTSLKAPVSFDPAARLGLDVEYFQFGGTYLFDGDDMRPFVALTAGVTHFGPTLAGVDSESYFSGSIGGGVQLLQTHRVGVRSRSMARRSTSSRRARESCSASESGYRAAAAGGAAPAGVSVAPAPGSVSRTVSRITPKKGLLRTRANCPSGTTSAPFSPRAGNVPKLYCAALPSGGPSSP